MKELGKGIATVGVWGAVAYSAAYGPAIMIATLGAIGATMFIWLGD